MYVYFSTHDFTFKLNFYTNFIQIFLCKFMQNYYITKFIQKSKFIYHSNSYQNYRRLERNIQEPSSTKGHWL